MKETIKRIKLFSMDQEPGKIKHNPSSYEYWQKPMTCTFWSTHNYDKSVTWGLHPLTVIELFLRYKQNNK